MIGRYSVGMNYAHILCLKYFLKCTGTCIFLFLIKTVMLQYLLISNVPYLKLKKKN